MRKRYLRQIAILIGLVALSGCVPAPTGVDQNQSTAVENVVEVELVSFEIHMPETLQAGTITFDVVNNSEDDEHSIKIEGQGIEEELESHLQPGEEGTLTVDLAPGTYRVYCPVEDHADEHGMEIEITVE
jgi:uncharacterized cupredoxin-like copper-binding protein